MATLVEETGEIFEDMPIGELSEEIIDQIQDGTAYIDSDNIIHVKEDLKDTNSNAYTGLAYEEACEVLRTLNGQKDFVAWTAGDIVVGLTEGIKKRDALRELIERISLDTNSNPDTITQYRWVSYKFPPGSERDEYKDNLTWSHFRACSGMEQPKEWLEKAANELWSVKRLSSELAAAKEDKAIEQNGGCSRYGCINNVSTLSTERVSLQAYGQKFVFCSAACATNVLLNDLAYIKSELLAQTPPVQSDKTILVNNPDMSKRDSIPEEEWFSERKEKELAYFLEKYGRIKKVSK